MRALEVIGGKVTNVVEVDHLGVLPNLIADSPGVGIGWSWDGQVFTAPPPADPYIPDVLSPLQMEEALEHFGMLQSVEQFVNGPNATPLMKRAWKRAQEFRRTSPTLLAAATQLGITKAQMDQVFIYGATVQA